MSIVMAALHRLAGHRVYRNGWMCGPHPGRVWRCLECQREWTAPHWTNALGRFEWKERG